MIGCFIDKSGSDGSSHGLGALLRQHAGSICEVLFVVLARNGEKKKHEEAAKCGGEKGGSEETAPGANCTKPRQECREAGPLFLRSRLELIAFGHSRKHKPGDGLTCYASSNDIFFFFFSVGERETLKHAPPIFVGRDN